MGLHPPVLRKEFPSLSDNLQALTISKPSLKMHFACVNRKQNSDKHKCFHVSNPWH